MKLLLPNQRRRGLTKVEAVVIVAGFLVLAVVVLLPVLAMMNRRVDAYNCISNVKQVNLSFRIWEGDNNNKYPMQVSVTNGGAMEWMEMGNVAPVFQVMSNELSTPKILICPMDTKRISAMDFGTNFDNSHISYFVSPDAEESHPERIMSGDDNVEINGLPAQSGLVSFSTNATVAWSPGRHYNTTSVPFLRIQIRHGTKGNIGYADGSVTQLSTLGLQQVLVETEVATNRFVIP